MLYFSVYLIYEKSDIIAFYLIFRQIRYFNQLILKIFISLFTRTTLFDNNRILDSRLTIVSPTCLNS